MVSFNPYMEESQKLKYYNEFMETGGIKKLKIDEYNSIKPAKTLEESPLKVEMELTDTLEIDY